MKRLVLFVVALVFVFSTTVMAADKPATAAAAETTAIEAVKADAKVDEAAIKADAKKARAEKKAAKKAAAAEKKAAKKKAAAEKKAEEKVEDAK
jgi:colicin import membrane protein